MRSSLVRRGFLAVTWLCFSVVALQIGTVSIVQAEEIAWRQVTEQISWEGGISERAGKATFKDGAVAAVAAKSRQGPMSAVDGSVPYEGQVVFTFPDGSTITARFGAIEKFDYTQSGSGEFVSGTGRFQGITGKYTSQGKRGDTENVGTYSLPGK